MPRYQSYRTLPQSKVHIGGGSGAGRENPETRLCINLMAQPTQAPYGEPTGEPMEICVELTVPQLAKIVCRFFSQVTHGIYGTFLHRLLEHRWATMSSPVTKSREVGGEGYEYMCYHKDPISR